MAKTKISGLIIQGIEEGVVPFDKDSSPNESLLKFHVSQNFLYDKYDSFLRGVSLEPFWENKWYYRLEVKGLDYEGLVIKVKRYCAVLELGSYVMSDRIRSSAVCN
ncbi:hypothetical protein CDAR_227321 [Caerostris darwini]|uniref:Uncharacterized protein n=1 Tax=Caerostris darwini TaxID=1538125 RepID=A0AAV4ULX8_9ARAC|nr:hypothetical protein CDAR_227321 [Caerostris darwini]